MRTNRRQLAACLWSLALGALASPGVALARQAPTPVYVDDAPGASEAIERARDLAGAGNVVEAARVLQRLLEEDSGRLVPRPGDPDLFRSVRSAVHETLLDLPDLLSAYREQEREAGERLLESGRHEAAERTRLLTTPGFEAALVVAQRRLERAQFNAALRVLRSLERHPDRLSGGGAARDAAAMATLAAQYIDTTASRDLASRWRAEAGLPEAAAPPVEHPSIPTPITPLSAVGSLDLSSLTPMPLHSRSLSISQSLPEQEEQAPLRNRRARAQRAGGSPQPFVLPTLAGDAIYINDGRTISALDRFSLSTLWRVEVGDIDTDRLARIAARRPIEDASSVSVEGRWVVAATGVAVDGGREGDPRIYALDARTGETRWRVLPSRLDPSLDESSVRGPLVIDEGVVVGAAAKQVRQRRLVSIHMFGLDLDTGALRWSRPLGSTGALPYGSNALPGEASAVEGGVVYRADRLGFVAAVETVTGRPVWVRRMPPAPGQQRVSPAWQMTSPVVVGGVVYTLTPDRSGVAALDAATGELLARRRAEEVSLPQYMLRAGDHLLFVGDATLEALPIKGFATASPVRLTGASLEDRFVGRVVVAGDRALAPVEEGVLVAPLDPEAGEPERLALDQPGNLLATRSQIVTVDAMEVHSYLLWDVAERILMDRMASSPEDPGPAATFAELAWRDGREDRIVPAIDSALRAIERAPMRREVRRVREQLFNSVLEMVQPGEGVEARLALGRATRVALLERLDRLASSPRQRVRRLIAAGSFHERGGDIGRAVEAYQGILGDEQLGEVRIELAQTSRPASDEAAARLRRIVGEHGARVYAPYAVEASRELTTAREEGSIESLERVARRYPVAPAAAEAWLEAARRREDAGRPRAAIAALEEGMRIADTAGAGDPALVGRIGGTLVRLLMAHSRVAAASSLLDRLATNHPGVTLLDDGESLDIPSLRAELSSLAARLDRRPRLGRLQTQLPAQVIRGLVATPPVLDPVSGGLTDVALLSNEEEFALWEIDTRSGLRQRWSVARLPDDVPALLDAKGLLISRKTETGRSLLLLSLDDGRTLWETEALATPEGDEGDEGEQTVQTPLGLRRSIRETLVSVEDGVIALVERGGRAVGVDHATGRLLWSEEAMDRVYDAAAGEGVLIVGGADDLPAGAQADAPAPAERESAALVGLDLRTGRRLHTIEPEGGQIRWVRVTPEGDAVVGLDRGVASYEMSRGSRRWFTGGPSGAEMVDAWVFPGRVIVMNNEGGLFQIETENGRPREEPLATRGRFGGYGNGLRPVWSAALHDKAAFATQNGIVLFDRRGDLVGADHHNAARLLAPVGYAQRRVIALDRQVAEQDRQGAWFRLLVLGGESLSLEAEHALRLGAQPERVDLLDERVLVTAGEATLVIDAPRGENRPAEEGGGPSDETSGAGEG